jgi:hypothetical protein
MNYLKNFILICFLFFLAMAFLFKKQQAIEWTRASIPCTDTTFCSSAGNVSFWKPEYAQKACPSGWRLPTKADLLLFVNELDGKDNGRIGGKEVDSVYLQTKFPFKLNGLFLPSRQKAIGVNQMTGFYTSSDTLMEINGVKKWRVIGLHIYRAGNGRLNIEPTYSVKEDRMHFECKCVKSSKL